MRYKISLFLVFSLFFVLTGCASSTIEYNGTVYNRSDLSEETIVLLEKYNSIPE